MKVRHVIATRLLSRQMSVKDILEDYMIDYRLGLLRRNLIATLNNQTNLDFEFVLLTNPKLKPEQVERIRMFMVESRPKFKWMLIPHDDRYKNAIRDMWKTCDVLAVTRIDDDDFIRRDVAANTMDFLKISPFNIAVMGYNHGYMYVDGKNTMDARDFGCRGGHMSIFQTHAFRTANVEFSPDIIPYSVDHDCVKREFNKMGLKVVYVDADQGKDEQFTIYFRHRNT